MEADGLVTTVPGLAISALSADCGPVLLADVKAGVIGACHAGWRGALSGIVESTYFHLPEGKKTHFDLPAFILSRLAVMGVRSDWTGHCTYAHSDDYFSYRRNTHAEINEYGRNLSAIALPCSIDSSKD